MRTAVIGFFGLVVTVGCAPVEVVTMHEEAATRALGGTISQCAADTAYFDGACRDLEWFETAFAAAAPHGTEFVGVVGGSARRGSVRFRKILLGDRLYICYIRSSQYLFSKK